MRQFTVDYHGADPARIEEGHYFVTARTVYRCVFVRPMDSKVWPDRWKLEAERVMTRAAYEDASAAGELPLGLFPMVWDLSRHYERGEGPSDNPCGDPLCEGCMLHK